MNKYSFISGLILGAAAYFLGYTHCRLGNKYNTISDTAIVTIYDTAYYDMPVTRDSVVVKHINRYVPVYDTILKPVVDSVRVALPITQKAYKDSTYEAWVSGYEPNLDSIKVYNKVITNTIQNTVTVQKMKKWGLGVQMGYGFSAKGAAPYIGVGIHYNLFGW
jgi:hypothetical protein